MENWKSKFLENRPTAEELEYNVSYAFGLPATDAQISEIEQTLEVSFPEDLRSLYTEFNGIKDTRFGDSFFLPTEEMPEVLAYFADSGNEFPPPEDLRKVIFFCQINGFSYLYGECVEQVGGFEAGTIVVMDHEIGEIEFASPNLSEFVRTYGKNDGYEDV